MDMQKSYRVVVGIGLDHSSCSLQKKIVSNQPRVNCLHHLLFLQSESAENN